MIVPQSDINNEYKHIVKNSLIIGLALIVIILLLLRDCNGKKCEESKPTVTYDTVYKTERLDTVYIPRVVTKYVVGNTPTSFDRWDTLYMVEMQEVDTAKIFEKFFTYNVYSDTIKNKYGYVLVEDTILGNTILSRGVQTNLTIPEITRTITLVQPRRSAVFIGTGLFGNKKELAAGYNINLSLKTKKDRMIEVGYSQFFGGEGYFSIGYKHKISLRK